jgi:hypothetical protein
MGTSQIKMFDSPFSAVILSYFIDGMLRKKKKIFSGDVSEIWENI